MFNCAQLFIGDDYLISINQYYEFYVKLLFHHSFYLPLRTHMGKMNKKNNEYIDKLEPLIYTVQV